MRRPTPVLAVVLLAGATIAQDEPALVIRGGRLFDPVAGEARELGQLWIANGRVLGEHAADAAIPEEARVIDAAGCTSLPGLIDLHTHVAAPGGPGGYRRWSGFDVNLASALRCGVTSVVDLHGHQPGIFRLRQRSREQPGLARLFAAGAAFTVPDGHGTQFGIAANVIVELDDVAKRFAALDGQAPDVIKAIVEHGDWGGLPPRPTLSEEQLRAVGVAAEQRGLPFFCHIWTAEEAKLAVRCGADALVHGVFVGEVDDELVAAMRDAGTAYVATLAVVLATVRAVDGNNPYDRRLVDEVLAADLAAALTADDLKTTQRLSFALRFGRGQEARFFRNLGAMADAGVHLGIGTDAGNAMVPHGPGLLLELQLHVDAGLTPARTLTAATLGNARILGVDDRLGRLAPGHLADVVIVRGDPVADIGAMWDVVEVIKEGTPVPH